MWSHCMAPSPWTTLWCPMAFQGKKNQETVKLVLPAVPWVTGFFVSDSGISSQNPCNCVGYLVNSLEGGKMNSFWYGNNMQTMNDFSLSLVLYNAIYVFWALIFSFGNLHKNLCLKKIMLRIKWGVMWAAETISYSTESILSFSYTRGTLFYSSGHQSQEKNSYSSFLCKSVELSSEVHNGIWAEAVNATFSLLERKNSLLYSFPLSNCLEYRHRDETLWTMWMGRQPTYGRGLRLNEPRSLSFWQNYSNLELIRYRLLGERKINFCSVWATAIWYLCCSNIPES